MSCRTDICGDFSDPSENEKGQCTPRRLKRNCGIPPIYVNEAQTVTLPCPDGTVGDTISVTVEAGGVSSPFSVSAANATALAQATAEAAALRAATPCVYASTEQSCTDTCPEGTVGDPITVTIPAGSFTSTVSQEAADAAALAEACAEVAELRAATPCYYESTEQSCEDVCPEGTTGDPITVTIPAGSFTSTVSQEAADAAALAEACAQVAELRAATPCEEAPAEGFGLWGAGENDEYELGVGDTSNKTSLVQVGSDETWTSVASGEGYSMGVKNDGTLWGVGDNSYGQLGDGTNTPMTAWTQIGTDSDWAMVTCGPTTTFALKTNGLLYGWGRNFDGEVGLQDYDMILGFPDHLSPAQIGSSTWTKISASPEMRGAAVPYAILAAIRSDGTLHFSTFDFLHAYTAQPVLTQEGVATNWTDCAAGSSHFMAINSSGEVYGMGVNKIVPSIGGSALGLGFQSATNTPEPLTLVDTGGSQVAAGRDNSLLVKSNGTLWSTGKNSNGQLGLGDLVGRYSFTQVGAETDWAQVSAGTIHSAALKTTSTLWTFGSDAFGQIANGGTVGNVTSPTQVGSDTDWSLSVAANRRTFVLKIAAP